MKKNLVPLMVFMAAAACAFAQNFQKPGVLTAIGQNSDVAVAHAALNMRMKMGLAYEPLMAAKDTGSYRTVILVVGVSAKGLGAAGVTLEEETERTKAIIAEAKAKDVRLVVVHIGGANRRGAASNGLIELCVEAADAVAVLSAGNEDKFFDALVAKRPGVTMKEAASVVTVAQGIFAMFAK